MLEAPKNPDDDYSRILDIAGFLIEFCMNFFLKFGSSINVSLLLRDLVFAKWRCKTKMLGYLGHWQK